MSSLNYQSSALGMVVYSEFSDCINNCIKIPVQIHKSTLFFDAIFLFSRIILIYYPYGIMEAVSRDSNIGTFRIIFLLYSRSSVDSGASLEREHLGAFNRPSVMTVTSEENQKTQPGFKPRLPGFLILSFFASIRTIRLCYFRPPRAPWGPLDSGLMRKRSLLSFF